ncbi:amidohydrolase family protein [Streptomyces profundus]|nr:amidohydrolase family protein [Streptomyces sp. MA3_2.13]
MPAGDLRSGPGGEPVRGWDRRGRSSGRGGWTDDGAGYVDRRLDDGWAAEGRPGSRRPGNRGPFADPAPEPGTGPGRAGRHGDGSAGAAGTWLTPAELARAAGAGAFEVTRLESLAEDAADRAGRDTDAFLAGLARAIGRARARSVAFKSVVAYRHGLHLAPAPPSRAELWTAAEHWLLTRPAGGRLSNPVLARHLLWSAVETGLPLQLHTGFGDPDLRLHRADPALLTDFVRAVGPTGCPLVLLHCYPFHRQAAHLAAVHPHVQVDLGLTLSHVGSRAGAVLTETLELAPFGKVLFSTDAYGLPELYLVGARQFRHALTEALTQLAPPRAEWQRIAALLAADNARRVYRLT